MTIRFPPKSSRTDEIEVLVGIFDSTIGGRTAIYVSTPLTTGTRYAAWTGHDRTSPSHPAYLERFQENVVEPNRSDARKYVAGLRRTHRQVVIDPSALADLADWSQEDYLEFWGRVISRYASTVVFRDGWEWSRGCSYEFLMALDTGAETLDVGLRPLSVRAGLSLLRAAIEERRDIGTSDAFISAVANAIYERHQVSMRQQDQSG